LSTIATALGRPEAALIAWIHFLAFDLFVGRWIYFDSQEQGLNPWLMAPVLLLTLLMGPAGLLAYLCVRNGLLARRKTLPPEGAHPTREATAKPEALVPP
jgi:hypothetical protein